MGTLGEMSDLAIQLSESGRDWLIHRPVDIAIYVVLALAVRYVLHRAIDRLVQGARRPESAEHPRRQWWAFLRRGRDPGRVIVWTRPRDCQRRRARCEGAHRTRLAMRAGGSGGRSERRPSGRFSSRRSRFGAGLGDPAIAGDSGSERRTLHRIRGHRRRCAWLRRAKPGAGLHYRDIHAVRGPVWGGRRGGCR